MKLLGSHLCKSLGLCLLAGNQYSSWSQDSSAGIWGGCPPGHKPALWTVTGSLTVDRFCSQTRGVCRPASICPLPPGPRPAAPDPRACARDQSRADGRRGHPATNQPFSFTFKNTVTLPDNCKKPKNCRKVHNL